MSTIRELDGKRFNGYLKLRIPHKLDEVVASTVDLYRSGGPPVRREMLDQVGPRSAGVLSAYGQRMATIAVRTQSEEPLRHGLVGMGMSVATLERIDGNQSNMIVLAAVTHAADSVGSDLSTLVDQVAPVLPDRAVELFREFTRRAPRDQRLAAMGLRTLGTGDEFRYA